MNFPVAGSLPNACQQLGLFKVNDSAKDSVKVFHHSDCFELNYQNYHLLLLWKLIG